MAKPSLRDPRENGIRVEVEARFLAEHSSPAENRWAFSYTVTITNFGDEAATLVGRHWAITDGTGVTEHVRGPGVVGYQPSLAVGQSFRYTSGAVLRTPTGLMEGEYLMVRADGSEFEALIPPFALSPSEFLH